MSKTADRKPSRALAAPREAAPRGLLAVIARALSSGSAQAMPDRVSKRIERHEDDAEILVRLFQLAIVTLFGSLYLFSPKTDEATAFAVAPYAISVYFVLTIIGLFWALRARLPDWAVYGSIAIDIGLLYVMIWSFHLQYEQPASFYLKAPTLLYVFIFIVLRALRFRARFVVATGLAAALGWIVLFVYAIVADPRGMMITRDYVAYLTGNFVLVGGEVDKIVSILTVTAILAIAIRRARAVLVHAAAEETAAQDLSRFFDASVAERIRGAEREVAAGEGVPREAAILYVDIRGFSTLAEQIDPNAVMRLLAEYQRRIVPLIRANGGTIDKFLGDGIMATFGAAPPSSTFAADAFRTLDAVIAETSRWKDDARDAELARVVVNASIASGHIIFGAVGDPTRLEYTVIGAPVNLAAKLEKHNKILGSRGVATREAFESACAQGYQPQREIEEVTGRVEGIADPVTVVIVHR